MNSTTNWSFDGKYLNRFAWILLTDCAYVSCNGCVTDNYLDVLVFQNQADAVAWASLNQHRYLSYIRDSKKLIPHYGTLSVNVERFLDPDKISISWCVDDVMSVDKNISLEQAKEVLSLLKHKHDASIGINWDVIQAAIKEKVWEN